MINARLISAERGAKNVPLVCDGPMTQRLRAAAAGKVRHTRE